MRRKEDPRFITGRGSYTDDRKPTGLVFAAIVRSPYPHADIRGIDYSAAASAPGVIGVFTGHDIANVSGPIIERQLPADIKRADTIIMATDRARYAGEPVAVVVAQSPYQARDGADLVRVDYAALPAVENIDSALAPGAPTIHEHAPGNVAYRWVKCSGDPDTAFAQADIVVSHSMINHRLAPAALESRSVIAEPDSQSGGLTITTSTQTPHSVKSQMANSLGLPESKLRVIAPDVGGGFGAKIRSYPEELIIASLAILLQKPVKWTGTRSEDLLATHHGRGQQGEIAFAATSDGTITGMRLRSFADLGAYARGGVTPTLTGPLMNGVYRYENVDIELVAVYTNTMQTGAYRGAGRPEATYYIERLMDILAAKLDMDPVEIRRKNFIPSSAFPYQTAAGSKYDSADYEKALTKLLEESDYPVLRQMQRDMRAEGRHIGIGITTFTEVCGLGPHESTDVRIEPDGTVTVATGISPHGQGQETTFAQMAADDLGVDIDRVHVIAGDTARTPAGAGTFGSRGLSVGGSALRDATQKLREKIIRIAAHKLESAAEDIELIGTAYAVRGTLDRNLTLEQVARAAYAGDIPSGMEHGLEAIGVFKPQGHDFPFGAHLAMVEIDEDTGEISLLRYISVDDCGTVFSPNLVDGQIHGGLAQGIGQALWEEMVYDTSGQLLTGSFMDYAMPRAADFPWFEHYRTETPTWVNPLGAKGIGELATVGSTPTIVNAVLDALRPFGVEHIDMPLRSEKVWAAMHRWQ